MLLLIFLITALLIGVGCFVGNHYRARPNLIREPIIILSFSTRIRTSCCVKQDLDDLLRCYEQGLLSEEQYLSMADKLVDELATLLKREAPKEVTAV